LRHEPRAKRKQIFWSLSAAIALSWGVTNIATAKDPSTGDPTLQTLAESSAYQRTGRYDEVGRLCHAFAARWPDLVRCFEFGRTPEGRSMLALSATRSKAHSAEEAHRQGIPIIVIQGGIHAGEIDGKDAGFLALREMLQDRAAHGALEKLLIVFVPVFNVDGHERFGRWNRPNQVGPEEMGWRTTSQNINLNRDYAKADAPEMGAMLRLLNEWDPILYVDLHVTDGAQFRHDVSILVEPVYTGEPALQPLGLALRRETNERLKAQGSLPLDFYPSLRTADDPASGFERFVQSPRFSMGYWALRNRLAMLVETHSWKDYATRVRITRNTIIAVSEIAARDGAAWLEAARTADDKAGTLGGTNIALDFEVSGKYTMIDFLGYAYTRQPSKISGGSMTLYDPQKPQIWRVPFYNELRPSVQELAPRGGYVVPPAHAKWVAERLRAHGIDLTFVSTSTGSVEAQSFRARAVSFGQQPFEGRMTAKLSGEWRPQSQAVEAGSLFVPLGQAKARLVMALLEPRAPDSLASWGFFNAHFETKEYMEDYVIEKVAREMLAQQPQLAIEFQERLRKDPQFATDPRARLDFFYRRHPSWDRNLNLYPVFRIETPPGQLRNR
jgi:hypothetical protein